MEKKGGDEGTGSGVWKELGTAVWVCERSVGEGSAPCGGCPREDCMVEKFKCTSARDDCEKNSGEREGPCACSYIGSGERQERRHRKRAGRSEGDDEQTVLFW
jgi:hypothetical protein